MAAAGVNPFPQWSEVVQLLQEKDPMLYTYLKKSKGYFDGTRVLIDAPVKIFLTATPEERARRRYRQQIEKGDMTPYEQVLAELNARDAQDMNRETDPLRQAEDAVLVDSTNMTPEQVVDAIIAVVEDVYGKRA